MITEEVIKKKLKDSINEELGIEDKVYNMSKDILEKILNCLPNETNEKEDVCDGVVKRIFSFRHDIFRK